MIVKFSHHGKGKAAGVLNYLLKEKGANGKQVPRKHATLLQGDPVITAHLIDTVKFKNKYKSGYLSFSERANEISEHDKKQIMQEFEDTIFAGLERDQYDIVWIEHADKDISKDKPVGRLELNFVIPCVELRTGRSLQPYYEPADQRRVNAWKNLVNGRIKTIHGDNLTDPLDPKRKRLVNPYNSFAPRPSPFDVKKYKNDPKEVAIDKDIIANPANKKELEAAIKRRLQLEHQRGRINSRLDVIKHLTNWGLAITRSKNAHSLSVTSDKVINKNGRPLPIRLKGHMFSQDFNSITYSPERRRLQSAIYRRPDTIKTQRFEDKESWKMGIELKTAYHQERYKDAIAPEPIKLKILNSEVESEPKPQTPKNTYLPSF